MCTSRQNAPNCLILVSRGKAAMQRQYNDTTADAACLSEQPGHSEDFSHTGKEHKDVPNLILEGAGGTQHWDKQN